MSRADSERLYTRNFLLAAGMHFTGGMSVALFILFPLFVAARGGDELVIGQVVGAAAAAAVLTRPAAGLLLDRLGCRTTLLLAGLAHALLVGALATFPGPSWALWVLNALRAIAAGALFAGYFTYAAHVVPVSRRIEGVAMFGVAGMLPNGLAPPLGELVIDRLGFPAFFACSVGFALVALGFTFALLDARADGPPGHAPASVLRSLGMLLRPELRALYLATLLFGFGLAALFTFLAPYVVASGRGDVGGFFLGYSLAAIAVRVLGARLPERVGPRRILLPALLGYGVGLAWVPFTGGPSGLLGVGLLCGTCHGYAFPILNVLLIGRTSARARGAAVSLFTGMIDLGTMVGGPVLGAIATASYPAMFLCAAAASWVAAIALMRGDRPALGDEPGW